MLSRKQTDEEGDGESGFSQRGAQQVLQRKTKASQLPRDIWRLLTNPIMMCLAVGRALDFVTGVTRVVQVKYLENQFRITPARAALYSAIFGMAFGASAQFIGSVGIKRFTPRPRTIMLAIWITQAIGIGLTAWQAHIRCDNRSVIVGQSDIDPLVQTRCMF